MSPRPNGSAGRVNFIGSSPKEAPRNAPSKEVKKRVPVKTPEPKEPEMAQPNDEPIVEPTMGFPAFRYKFSKMLNKDAKPPKLSHTEIALRKEAEEKERRLEVRADGIARIRELSDLVTTLNIVYIGIKGGAATTTTMVHSASIYADITRTDVTASDFNPASGTAGARLGKDIGQTMTLEELRLVMSEIEVPADIKPKLRPTRYGVRVLSANDYVSEASEIYGNATAKMLDILTMYSEYNFIDTANDITSPSSRAILEAADVLVFTANVNMKDSLRQLGIGMQNVRKSFGVKVANSIVVVSNTPPGADPEDYRKFTDRVNLENEVKEKYNFLGPIVVVPRDEVVAQEKSVELESLDWETYQAYLGLNILTFEQALEIEKYAPPRPKRSSAPSSVQTN